MHTATHAKKTSVIRALTKDGYELLRRRRTAEAEERFRAALAFEADNAYALCGLGDAALQRGAHGEAAGYYGECLERNPDNDYASFFLGECYCGLNDFRKAIDVWRGGLESSLNKPLRLAAVADAHRALGEYEAAERYYAEALALDPDGERAVKGFGRLYYERESFGECVEYWEKALARDGGWENDPEVLNQIGNCLRRMREYGKALPWFERALVLSPGNFAALFGTADCLRGAGGFAEARRYYEAILEREPDNRSILTRAGDMCVNTGDLEAAERHFSRALELGDDLYALLGRAHILEKVGRFRDALRRLEDADRKFPGNRRVREEIRACREKLR